MALPEQLTFTSPLVESTEVSIDDVPTDYTVVLGYHWAPIDFPSNLRDLYGSADVVLHEAIGWVPRQVTDLNRLSFADEPKHKPIIDSMRDEYLNYPLSMKRLKIVSGTEAGHAFWDVPKGHPKVNELRDRRGQTAFTPEAKVLFNDAVIEADQIALQALKGRIHSIEPTTYKSDRRHVVVHAGMSHVLLYNALRIAATNSGSRATLHIPFDHNGLDLYEQTNTVIEAVAAVKGEPLSDEMWAQIDQFTAIDETGEIPRKATHTYAKAIWDLVRKSGTTEVKTL